MTTKSKRIDCKCQPDANKDHPDCLDVGERVIVRCNGFRCLAYCDRDGIWRLGRTSEPLSEDPLEIIFRFRESGPPKPLK